MNKSYTSKYNLQMDKNNTLKPYITIAEYGITFTTDALESLHFAKYVHVFYDDANKVVAFQACEKDANSFSLCKEKDYTKHFVRWSGRRHRDHIANLIDAKLTKKGIRLNGKYLEDEDLLIFELADYKNIAK